MTDAPIRVPNVRPHARAGNGEFLHPHLVNTGDGSDQNAEADAVVKDAGKRSKGRRQSSPA